MKINYFKDTDTLYLELDNKQSVESSEISPGIVFDYDENNKIVGIEIDHASTVVNLGALPISKSIS